MATVSKNKITEAPKKPQLKKDLASIVIPFDLFSGMASVIEELESKGLEYSHFTNKDGAVLYFISEGEEVNVSVEKETLLVRQYNITDNLRKLNALYVVKPSQRKFELVTIKKK